MVLVEKNLYRTYCHHSLAPILLPDGRWCLPNQKRERENININTTHKKWSQNNLKLLKIKLEKKF